MTGLEKGRLTGFVIGLIFCLFLIIFYKSIGEWSYKSRNEFWGKLMPPKSQRLDEFIKKYESLIAGIIGSIMCLLGIISILLKK